MEPAPYTVSPAFAAADAPYRFRTAMTSAIIGVTGRARSASIQVLSAWLKYDITVVCQESFRNRLSTPYSAMKL